MPNLYVCGASAINYYSKCAIAQTADLTSFQSVQVSTQPLTHILAAARSTDGTCLFSNNAGGVIKTTDFDTYVTYDMNYQQSQFLNLTFNDKFVAVGYQRNDLNQEQAYVWISDAGFDQYSWQARYAIMDTYSAFTNVCTISSTGMAAVGHANQLQTSVLITGTATGTWQRINLPNNLQGGLWSVASDGVRIWIGGKGWIATALIANLNSWTRTDLTVNAAVTSLIVLNGVVVAVAGDSVFYSLNNFDYKSHQILGRTLTSCYPFGGKVILGSHSLLNQSDLFVFDPVTKQVSGTQTGVHAYAFVTV